jgi:hypothetical protein
VSYKYPVYLTNSDLNTPQLNFPWDDWKASKAFTFEAGKLLKLLDKISIRGRLALGTGVIEWISYRFSSVNDDPAVEQIIEAGWCGIVDANYMRYVEFDRDKWLGPVKGPLWCALTWYVPMIFFSEQGDEVIESGLDYLIRLTMHVIPRPMVFEQWLEKCIDRLIKLYPCIKEDPFSNLFGEEDRRGPLLSREVLDINSEYVPENAKKSINSFFKSVEYKANPFLNSPEVMLENGFEGKPYTL